MIQSTLTVYGMLQRFAFFALTVGSILYFPIFLTQDRGSSILLKEKASVLEWCFYILVIIFSVTASLIAVLTTRKISIGHDKITYTNWLIGKEKIYNFKDLDGYVTIVKPRRIMSIGLQDKDFESIILVKENKRIGEISSYFYSNYDELKGGLKDLKYLGREDYSMLNRRLYLEPMTITYMFCRRIKTSYI